MRAKRGLYNSIGLPRIVEMYRTAVFFQLYDKMDTTVFQSVCWASPESEHEQDAQQKSKIVVLPGEEKFLLEHKGVSFNALRSKAIDCPYAKTETTVFEAKKTIDEEEVTTPQIRRHTTCRLSPNNRPLMCRLPPFTISRVEDRKAEIRCNPNTFQMIQRKKGDIFVRQMFHGIMQLTVSMWPFLTPSWWTYYENCLSKATFRDQVSIISFGFELTDDMVISSVRGAPPEWKRKMLLELANPDCEECEGDGIEFWDHLPVPQRRFDLCRMCVLPQIGARIGNEIVDSRSGKVLTADGLEYRGD